MGIEPYLSESRWATYNAEAGRAGASAESLYVWNSQLSSALFEVLGHLECALRQAIDGRLRVWNAAQDTKRFIPGIAAGPEWAVTDWAAAPLRSLVQQKCREASNRVRRPGRPSHDDVVAQLSFGIWLSLIPRASRTSSSKQWRLWDEAIIHAFPHLRGSGPGYIYKRLARLRDLRNRIAHHENLLAVNTEARLSDVLAILACIDQPLADYVAGVSRVREVAFLDPRRQILS